MAFSTPLPNKLATPKVKNTTKLKILFKLKHVRFKLGDYFLKSFKKLTLCHHLLVVEELGYLSGDRCIPCDKV